MSLLPRPLFLVRISPCGAVLLKTASCRPLLTPLSSWSPVSKHSSDTQHVHGTGVTIRGPEEVGEMRLWPPGASALAVWRFMSWAREIHGELGKSKEKWKDCVGSELGAEFRAGIWA